MSPEHEEILSWKNPSRPLSVPHGRCAASAVGNRAHAGIDWLSTAAHHTVDRAASAAVDVADQLETKKKAWPTASDEWMQATRGYVRDHSIAAPGIALAAGYLFSRLLARG